ncbi:MAG TPA: TolC family protein [Casimicrobiaceae bacterium]|nr:TolC family protein [Casimicrobiaceae bacterium]
MRPRAPVMRITGFAVLALWLGGCATLSQDGGVDTVRTLARERIGANVALPAKGTDSKSLLAAAREILAKPLTVDDAVQLALLNNPGLRASFAEMGVAEADLVQAGRLANPRFSYSNRKSSDITSIDRAIAFNVMALVAMPLLQKVASRQFEAAQLQIAGDVLQLAGDTRRAYFSAVAAHETAKYFEQVKLSAEASAELAARMTAVGNFNRLTQMREQAFYSDATVQLAKAKVMAVVERERLTRLLGLAGPDARFQLPERLPDLPGAPLEPVDAERTALEQRLDVQLARRSAETMAANLGLTKATRFINVLELGYTNESNTGEKRQNGYEIEIALPLFDWVDAKLARAEAVYMQTVERTAQVAIAAQSEVRETYQTYRTFYDVARHYREEIVPLRKRIADENVLRYNGMLISVFELLADAREQIASVNAYIEALRDFWIADSELQLALNGKSPGGLSRSRALAMPAGGAAVGH